MADSPKKDKQGKVSSRNTGRTSARKVTKEDMDESGAQALHPGRGWARRGDDRRTAK